MTRIGGSQYTPLLWDAFASDYNSTQSALSYIRAEKEKNIPESEFFSGLVSESLPVECSVFLEISV